MVLQDFEGPQFLRCERLFVNTENKDPIRSRSNFDMVFELSEVFEKVQAVELVSWTVPYDMSPTIYEATTSLPANNLLDVRLSDPPGNTHILEFTVELQPLGYASVEALGQSIGDQITFRLRELADPFYDVDVNFCTVTYSVTRGKLSFAASVGDPAVAVDMRFMFGTGPSAGATPARALGMTDGVDTLIATVNGYDFQGPVAGLPALLYPARYVDVTVSGVDYKVARIPLTNTDFVTNRFNRTKFRLLDNSLRRIQDTRITLTLPKGVEPVTISTSGYDMVLDYLVLTPVGGIPYWLVQSFKV